ncbi:Aldehyde Dehydrogenase [Crinalium epipsammum PCC 9333]|uniref:Aldehyde dehydrogenase n=1 Tax=Crinalium epipsammum PCC 9333 TaxID=1173022 RepID=K9W0K3_9CYAN|nr:aldehyde dehydrogenase [Crinalium epipsammum]AFZ13319.1 Aldehyde Dehydrogenase [Crinalium epipsammum PCC 9333]
MLTQQSYNTILTEQRHFFASGKTKDVAFRIEQLKLLKKVITEQEINIQNALKDDLNKSEFESYLSEIGLCLEEINYAIKHIKSWAKPQKVNTPLTQFLASSQIYSEPLGIVLIIGAWNYPFQLMILPLVGAIAAGNCAILKPSELAVNTSEVLSNIINQTFASNFIHVIEGGKETTQQLLSEKFDHIFFTGSTEVGKIVMAEAAKQLTPVTLELGGKTPCIVDANTHIEYTARRIVWGKFLNAGQTCIAPDYLLVDKKVKQDLLTNIKSCIQNFYGNNPVESPDYGRIINEKHFNRLCKLLNTGEIIIGGENNLSDRYIAPTVIDRVSWEDAVMKEEIFGPILPVIEYNDLSEAIALVNSQPKPLALYFFSNNQQKQQQILRNTSSGGVSINDTVMHTGVPDLPFGGVGASGMGSYHGKASFDTFSHKKSILNKSFLVDLKVRYAPYKEKLKLVKQLMKS